MKPEEAIEILKTMYPKTCKMVKGVLMGGFDDIDCEEGKAISIAIEALSKNIKEE